MDTLQIIREDPERRGEYYKEFVLNGGLRMAAVYADAVHYQKDGQWEPIDNTLKLSGGAYVNTTGVWQVSLPQQFSSSYTYDEEGNVTSVTDLQGQITDYEYDDINNTDLLRIIQDNKAKVTYTYDPYHNVETATTQEGVTYEFEYDVYGNNTAVSIKFGEIAITSTANYTDDGNRLDYTTDALGNETHYSYHPDTNLLQWVKAPEDTEASRTEYTYDTMYRLASVTAKVDGNATKTLSALYGYTDDLLTSIETESTTYTFAYGDFALRSSIQIGERTLAEYSYTDKNHYLQRLDYGNEDMVEYSYDNNGNLIAQLYEDGDTVTYKYDNSGELASVTDSASGLTAKYYYDLTGRLMKYTETGTDFSHSAAYTYDKLNNLTKLQETIGSTIRDTTYTYDDDNRVIGTSVPNAYRGFTYDEYGRLENRTTKYRATDLITESFGFSGNGTAGTSGQVSSHSFAYGSTQFSHGYSYDDNGNIKSILKNGSAIVQYGYDSQNQLIRENNLTAGKTWTWSYDDAGNILTRTEYNYTTGELGTAIDVVSYAHTAYTDTDWGDLLTAYDGNTITYDAIGNPLTDGRWTYTWEHGRELASMAENTAVVITTQPEDCFCAVGQSCSFTVAAQGERLTYRWQYSADGGTTWIDSVDATAVTSTMTIDVAEASQIGLLWRCIVTDKDGRTAISQSGTVVDSTATRSITITNQPDDFYCATGDTTAFAVEAAGEGLTYHWQYSSDGSEWSNIYSETAFTPTYSWNGVHPSQFGTYYRCQITDADGNVTYSRGARLKTTTSLWEYTYNADGLRTKRTNGDRTYEYTYLGSQLTRMTVDGHDLYFTYDAAGTPLTVSCDGTLYYYITNIQGDVIAIIDTAGTQVTSYIYDAWGNIISHTGSTSTIGTYNPLRYRGYVYDTETGLYYLQSRYYNPKVGRFINADSVIAGVGGSIQGYNMFAYCFNNPVNMSDPSGNWPKWIETAANWVNENIIQPVANFFSPNTNTISGQFQEGIFRGSGSLTGSYSESNWRLDDKIKSSGSQDGWVGGFGYAVCRSCVLGSGDCMTLFRRF